MSAMAFGGKRNYQRNLNHLTPAKAFNGPQLSMAIQVPILPCFLAKVAQPGR